MYANFVPDWPTCFGINTFKTFWHYFQLLKSKNNILPEQIWVKRCSWQIICRFVGVSSWHRQYVEIFIGQYPKESWFKQGNYSHIKPLFSSFTLSRNPNSAEMFIMRWTYIQKRITSADSVFQSNQICGIIHNPNSAEMFIMRWIGK